MATTKEDIIRWFKQGVERGAKYMLVKCDTFDWSDYPSYADNAEECMQKYRNPGDMQKIMEVYDLTDNMMDQVEAGIVMRIPGDRR